MTTNTIKAQMINEAAKRSPYAMQAGLLAEVVNGKIQYSNSYRTGGRRKLSFREALMHLDGRDIRAIRTALNLKVPQGNLS